MTLVFLVLSLLCLQRPIGTLASSVGISGNAKHARTAETSILQPLSLKQSILNLNDYQEGIKEGCWVERRQTRSGDTAVTGKSLSLCSGCGELPKLVSQAGAKIVPGWCCTDEVPPTSVKYKDMVWVPPLFAGKGLDTCTDAAKFQTYATDNMYGKRLLAELRRTKRRALAIGGDSLSLQLFLTIACSFERIPGVTGTINMTSLDNFVRAAKSEKGQARFWKKNWENAKVSPHAYFSVTYSSGKSSRLSDVTLFFGRMNKFRKDLFETMAAQTAIFVLQFGSWYGCYEAGNKQSWHKAAKSLAEFTQKNPSEQLGLMVAQLPSHFPTSDDSPSNGDFDAAFLKARAEQGGGYAANQCTDLREHPHSEFVAPCLYEAQKQEAELYGVPIIDVTRDMSHRFDAHVGYHGYSGKSYLDCRHLCLRKGVLDPSLYYLGETISQSPLV